MFVALAAFLSIFQLVYAEDPTERTVLASNMYDHVALKEIKHHLDLLQTTIDNLRLKIDSQNLIIDQQFENQQIEFKKDMDQQFTQQRNEFKKSVDQLQDEFRKDMGQEQNEFKNEMSQRFTQQRNEYKKDFDDLKLAFTTLKEPLMTAESKDGNLTNTPLCTDFKNQHLKINQSEPITTTETLSANCNEALEKSGQSGIYKIKIPNSELEPFNIYCLSHVGSDLENNTQAVNSSNAAWMIVQRRQDGSVDFNRNSTDYQHGFGDLKGEFFIGLDKLHELTKSTLHELWIQLEDFEGSKRWAKYSRFSIGGKNESYVLKDLGTYTGDAFDALSYHTGQKWSSKDANNEYIKGRKNCAILYKGGWWFKNCHYSHLNGEYLRGDYSKNTKGKGIFWHDYKNSLKYDHMAIRPV